MYTYVFLRSPDHPLNLPEGIAASPRLLRSGELCALVESDLGFEALQSDDDRLMRAVLIHDHMVRAVFEQVDVLPLRFGTRFHSESVLLEHMARDRALYLDKLNSLAGKAEYTLKLIPIDLPEPDLPAGLTGREYFLAKKQRIQTQAQQQQQRQEELYGLKLEITQQFPSPVFTEPQEGIERIHLLSDREAEFALAQSLKRWQEQFPHWEMSFSEALPPYHFV